MDWFIRFSIGLPARAEDVVALRRVIPELDDRDTQLEHNYFFWFLSPNFDTNRDLFEAIREWAAMVEYPKEIEHQDSSNCSLMNCPVRSKQSKDNSPLILDYLIAAGGPDAKSPKDSFLNLVRKTHPESDKPYEVIVTDPYIYSDVSEDNREGGFSNFILYLETLGLSSDDPFTLCLTPSPKRGTQTAKKNLHRFLKSKFKNITIKDYAPKLKFHDRFYVVRHKSGMLKGLFGPSMNGLSSDAIVLMGDIDGIQPLKKLDKWFW